MRAAARRWGYHRLSDEWARRVVFAADVAPTDLVLDIGAGFGALTFPLAHTGARVIAIELHAARAAQLRQRCTGEVKVVTADAASLTLPRKPFRVVSNPPFAVSTSIINHLTRRGSHLLSADLVLPWYVTKRWVRENRRGWVFGVGLRVPASAFSPRATSDTTVLRIQREHRRL